MSDLHPATAIFLDLYRIRPGHADLDLLYRLAREFSHLPWENLTKFLKKHSGWTRGPVAPPVGSPGSVSPPLRWSQEVMRDHAELGTGGTCFSLTNALHRIVTDLGYAAFPVMADMQHGPNVHCGLVAIVEDRRYLLDPGYLVPTPVPVDDQPTALVRQPGHRLEYSRAQNAETVELRTSNSRGETKLRYRVRLQPVSQQEFCRHWEASFEAPGMRGLQLNLFTSEGRLSAHDYNLRLDSGGKKRNIKLRERYAETISEHFGIDSGLARDVLEQWKRVRWPEDESRTRS